VSGRIGSPQFQTTCWTAVRQVSSEDTGKADAALTILCETYWYPIYAFIRRSNFQPPDAEDLTQDFFARIIRRDLFAAADVEKGKLRTFLLTCLRNFLADMRDREAAQKRGPGLLTSICLADAEKSYAREPVEQMSPDRLFQRQWAMTMLESSLGRLRQEFADQDKAGLFEALRPFLGFGSSTGGSYEEVSTRLAMPLGTLKSHVFRLRQRWRDLLFQQVALTLDEPTPELIKAELAELLGCL
jgi:RNA polymerase sigma-70 factor (ECF subfamily)